MGFLFALWQQLNLVGLSQLWVKYENLCVSWGTACEACEWTNLGFLLQL